MRLLSVAYALCLLYSGNADAHVAAPALIVQGGLDGVTWDAAAELLAAALRAAGAAARTDPRPLCDSPPDSWHCLSAARMAMQAARGDGEPLVVLALAVGAREAGELAPRLRDARLADLGDASTPARRACLQLSAPLPSPAPQLLALDQLADPTLAAAYSLPRATLQSLLRDKPDSVEPRYWCNAMDECENGTYVPEWCRTGAPCADVLVGALAELRVLRAVLQTHRLRARLTPLGPRLAAAAAAAAAGTARPALLCGWRFELPPGRELTPPPCTDHAKLTGEDVECPFEPRRLAKAAPEVALTRWPRVARVLERFWVSQEELRELGAAAAARGAVAAAAAAQAQLGARWSAEECPPLRVAAMFSLDDTPGDLAVAAAAALAEETFDANNTELPFKVQLSAAGCSSALAFRLATEALGGGEFGTLAGLAAPACGAGRSAGGALAAAFRLPALAYAPAAPLPGGWGLLAAGDAADAATAAAALLAARRWRRLAVLSQGARLAAVLRRVDLLAHTELPERHAAAENHTHLIEQWVERAVEKGARILLVAVEEGPALQAALCAGARRGLLPTAGAAWLLLAPPDAEPLHECALSAADHSLALRWEWAQVARAAPAAAAWRADVARHCALQGGTPQSAGCAPDARAALLYDALHLWARALHRMHRELPAALDNLHDPEVARKLIEYATTINYTGLTGPFEWGPATEEAGEASPGASVGPTRARRGAILVTQWRGGQAHAVARWERGALLPTAEPRWLTADGRAPRDGAECALGALGELLGSCGAALGALAALLLGALLVALGGAALYGKRRLERDFRARLQALARAPPHADRWELPRPHVVVNRRLGSGAFGAVYGGHARLTAADRWTAVAVKMLRTGASREQKMDFLAEAEAMKRLEHPNVVRLLGVVTQSEPVCCVMEFLLYGDLKSYLQARRQLAVEGDPAVAPPRLTALARDAARALSYLAEQHVVHCDVAARNCLVAANGTLKLADFGMSRGVSESDYYRLGRSRPLPVRWLAPEALTQGVFSPASDVWALAILLLEIVTFGALPYAELTTREVIDRVAAGCAPELPPGIQPPLAGLLKACWARAPGTRPAAAEVAAWLGEGDWLLTACLYPPAPPPPGAGVGVGVGAWWGGSSGTDCTYVSDVPSHAPLLS